LLEQEIPQVKSGIIAIRDILRLPGLMSKVLVERGKVAIEKRLNIDPAGTCIGEAGERAKSISRLIYSEQIYFVDWAEDKKKLLAKLISPVKLIKLIIKKENEWEIVIPQQRAALLLQYEGKILKKISDYLGINIHVQILEEIEKDEDLANKGQVMQEIGNYKNIDVRIVEDIEK
jgi:transcription termination/antitermination protein NusA